MMGYIFSNEYKTDLHRHIDVLFTQAKALNTSREQRLEASDRLIEDYFAHTEKIPDSGALERLATLLLRDELTDATPWKTRNTEYPIESDRQQLDYYNGLTTKQVPESYGVDGVDYRTPTRRIKTPRENAHIDRELGRKRRNGAKGDKTK